ncbi:YbaB/EbfC family nucleoid-associated protein [Kibdelosporangium philippinense]|uniref:YbaB/EbfC family nucleoid-associated protein n=1 Tax=Kibdelosporangium philippinense TaxID=211113 RepID=A0ABS8Z3H1_9PSEU|nr:YbaB/EbfC family nucleoid-associated protein [Kibdelosporangium philippinense]MCE7001558.1 YbaB/EbfC family nucleoid-associated protein [Kibdelosporangium philippinense]
MSPSLQDMAAVRRRVAEISVSVTAPRKVVTITVGQHGQITDLQFPTSAYLGLSPADLATTVMRTLRQAQAQARERVATLMAPVVPPHFDLSGPQPVEAEEPDESGIFRKLIR